MMQAVKASEHNPTKAGKRILFLQICGTANPRSGGFVAGAEKADQRRRSAP
jgi:hypothetical protein